MKHAGLCRNIDVWAEAYVGIYVVQVEWAV